MNTQRINQTKNSSYIDDHAPNRVYPKERKDKFPKKVKVVIISFTPTPYRDTVYDIVADKLGDEFKVYYCGTREPIRDWKLKKLHHNHLFLKGWNIKKKGGWSFVYINFDVWKYLLKDKPEVVITTGFNPTHLFGWLYCLLFGKAHVPFTDTWAHSDSVLTVIHRIVRKMVFSTSKAFLGPGKRTAELYQSYGASPRVFFQSHLAANTTIFKGNKSFSERKYDLMFAGQLHPRKSPLFFVEVAKKLKADFPKLKVLILGNGPQKEEMLNAVDKAELDYDYPGFVQPDDLPSYYGSSKLFLFPTKLDAWGVVANEALASGTPVLVTPYAGAANDLVYDDENGYVLDLDTDLWVTQIRYLLKTPRKWQELSLKSVNSKKEFTYEKAAEGIISVYNLIVKGKTPKS